MPTIEHENALASHTAESSRSRLTVVFASERRAGFWSAVLATVLSLIYVAGQLAEWFGWLGSQGGQLTLVGPRLARGQTAGIEPFIFVPFDSFLYAVDILGYCFMSVATFCAGFVFQRKGLEGVVRSLLLANGLILPFLALQMYYHPLIWIASLWAVTFPGATWSLALFFRRLALRPAPLT